MDDYQRQAMSLADWSALPLGTTTVVFSEPARDQEELVVVAMRERMAFPASVLERLPRLYCSQALDCVTPRSTSTPANALASPCAAHESIAPDSRPPRRPPGP